MIPADPKWCSNCILSEDGPCPRHRGPDGAPVPYEGDDAYIPSDRAFNIVGKRFNTMSGPCLCFAYDPRHGFWLRDEATGKERNVSERAINRTVHRIWDDRSPWA